MLPQLDTNNFISQIFWLTLFFGALYLFVSYFVIPNIEKVLNQRNRALNSIILESEKNNNLALQKTQESIILEKEYRVKMVQIYDDIITKVKNENEKNLKEIISKLSEDRNQTASQYQKYLAEAKAEIIKNSDEISEIVLKKISIYYSKNKDKK